MSISELKEKLSTFDDELSTIPQLYILTYMKYSFNYCYLTNEEIETMICYIENTYHKLDKRLDLRVLTEICMNNYDDILSGTFRNLDLTSD